MLTAGALIAGKYRVIKKLGEGAMGSVWLAKNEVTDREFAIKVLLPEAAAAPSALARFLREARVCGTLRHPSILEIYDAGAAPEIGGAPYLVMERLDGAPLDTVLRLRGALAPRLALDIVVQISRGLELAHAKGIVHRDLKPANVFLHRPGSGAVEPKVLDFGISKVVSSKSPEIGLTNTSAILGSPIYMSPEQMSPDTPLDARSDVHALGVLLWELLTGSPPFTSTSYNLLVVEIMRGPRPKLRDAMPSASKSLAMIVDRAFAIDRSERFASAAKLADALDAELADVGGGVLGGRTAATDILGGMDLSSNAPPPMHATTTEPISVDPGSVVSPSARSISGGRRASATSFADTQVAAASVRAPAAPPAAAVSAVREGTGAPQAHKTGSSLGMRLGIAAVALVALVGGVLTVVTRHAASEPVSAEPAAKVSAAAAATPPPPVVVPPTPAPAASALEAPPATSASSTPAKTHPQTGASASPTSAPKKPPSSRGPSSAPPPASAPAPPSRPRIDQSGL
jgi:serine/threonine protein kinase